MRFYKVHMDNDLEGVENKPRTAWASTQAEARAAKADMAEAHGLSPRNKFLYVTEVDVPTDKQSLLQFLQDNVKE